MFMVTRFYPSGEAFGTASDDATVSFLFKQLSLQKTNYVNIVAINYHDPCTKVICIFSSPPSFALLEISV